MRKTAIYYLIFFLVLGFKSFAQMPNFTPPTPEAASLAKFTELPVSYYSGLPNINIPIYTFSEGNVQVPISVSYHAKGIQVSELASRVGLGWALNAGGAITRQIRVQPDETQFGYLRQNYTEGFLTTPSLQEYIMGSEIANQELHDYAPDLYSFNFLGFSGKFIINQMDKKPVLMVPSDMEIKVIYAANSYRVNSFIVKDDKGVTYYFGESSTGETAKDQCSSNNYRYTQANGGGYENLQSPSPASPTTWHLMEIRTPQNEKISFSYVNEPILYFSRTSEGKIPNTNKRYLNYSYSMSDQYQLSAITSSSGQCKILFDRNTTAREDLTGGAALESIRIQDKAQHTVRKFSLVHSYRTSPAAPNLIITAYMDSTATKRLFLDRIIETGSQAVGVDQPLVYKFDYNQTPLPNRHSNSMDIWGYANSAVNSDFLVVTGQARLVDLEASKAGMLEKITYPTGGYTEFVYEHNKVIPPQYYSRFMISNTVAPTAVHKSFTKYLPPNAYDSIKKFYEFPFKIQGSGLVSINGDVDFLETEGCAENAPSSPNCKFDIFITTASGGILSRLTLGTSQLLDYLPGDYILRVVPKVKPDDDFEQGVFDIKLNWNEPYVDPNGELLGPGKRIQKITNRDAAGIMTIKEYGYTDPDNNNKSSGKVFSIPPFYYIVKEMVPNTFEVVGESAMTGGGPCTRFSGGEVGYAKVTETVKGSQTVGKTEYTFTHFNDQGEFYKYSYHIPTDMSWARGLPLTTIYFKGFFKNSVLQYLPVRKIDNRYIYFNNTRLTDPNPYAMTDYYLDTGIDILDTNPGDYLVSPSSPRLARIPLIRHGHYHPLPEGYDIYDPYKYKITYFLSGRVNIDETKETDYFYNGFDVKVGEIVRTTNFVYESPKHHQLQKKIETTSTGDTAETHYYYPEDPEVDEEPCVSGNYGLINVNIRVPLKTVISRNGIKISEQKVKYKLWPGGIFAPEVIQTAKGSGLEAPDGVLENRIVYEKVDFSNGKPLQVKQANGISVCYIWGYDKTKVVAKIENITYESIPETLIGAIQQASDAEIYDEAAMVLHLKALHDSTDLANANVTTFSYKPLVGISRVTLPNRTFTRYVYDGFGRLKEVYDHNNKLLSTNEYHYNTPN